ncbi:MAG: hypothetical protein Q8865_00115 [Bacillota bacterium]|nr:hypothetical protein [Bacillota bacterium]
MLVKLIILSVKKRHFKRNTAIDCRKLHIVDKTKLMYQIFKRGLQVTIVNAKWLVVPYRGTFAYFRTGALLYLHTATSACPFHASLLS